MARLIQSHHLDKCPVECTESMVIDTQIEHLFGTRTPSSSGKASQSRAWRGPKHRPPLQEASEGQIEQQGLSTEEDSQSSIISSRKDCGKIGVASFFPPATPCGRNHPFV